MVERGAKGELVAVAAAARAAWPDVSFDDDDFVAFLRASAPRAAAATAVNAGDLLLAFACARGDATALRIVEREYLVRLEALLPARHRDEAAEIVQIVRERVLLPAASKPARIEDYTGRGTLQSWLRVAATRVGANLRRSRRREVPLDEDRLLAERASEDLEIDDLKRRYRIEFRAAFAEGMSAVGARDRVLLRQHYIDGLTMDAIASLRRVHRVTVIRWMEAARAALARETRRELRARLRIDGRELESILRLIESQMDVSLRTFLGDE